MNSRKTKPASSADIGRPRLKKTNTPSQARLLLTGDNRLFIEVITTIPSGHIQRTLGVKLIGPIDKSTDPKEYFEYAELDLAQTQKEIARVLSKISALGSVFSAEVDLLDLQRNFIRAVAAMEAKNLEALRRLCPNPSSK